ncbi:MAG: hypothetical protein H5U40_06790, partial [Polyangiaceae bacterium]|nr:hypothetical protein [Polyangiaceae bacterium]
AANDFLAHESPRTGGPAARASAGGVESALLLENVGRGPSAVDVHRGFMASPGHRGNLLNEGATHIGVGVVARPHGERIDYIVTVMFISVAAEIDPDRAADELLTAINAARRARNVPPIEAEPNLAAPARRAAGRFFEEPTSTQRELVDSATAEVRGLSLPYLRTGGVMALATEVTEAAELESLLEPNLRYVGIGVAQGTRPGRPPNSLAIVVLMAWPR